jgi:UDP:flavonoid glycosyltransferase YjiC (YdhE family)
MILDAHQPKLFVFDGAFPYRGMLNAIKRKSSMRKVWMRRGMFKKGSRIPVGSVEFFDTVVHPGDAIPQEEDTISHNVEVKHVPPILLVDEHEKLAKAESRSRLGVPNDVIVWYLQLGAGQINDIESEVRITVECILESDSSCYIVIGESLLGQRIDFQHERVRLLRDYPNSIYLNGVDYSVQAGGYNSFHEMRVSRTPTIFFPNMKTGMDDQLARCKVAVNEGWGVVVETRTKKNILSSIAEVQCLQPHDEMDTVGEAFDMNWVSSLL